MKALFCPQAKRYRCADLFAAVLAGIVTIILRMVSIFPDRDVYVTSALETAKKLPIGKYGLHWQHFRPIISRAGN